MFTVKIQYSGMLDTATGKSEEHLQVAVGTTPLDIAGRIAGMYDSAVRRVMFGNGDSPRVLAAINGRLAPLRQELRPGDTVRFVPPLCGG